MTDRSRRIDELADLAKQAPWLAPTVEASMARAREDNLHQLGDDIMSLNSLHRRLDRIDGNHDELHGLVESLERAGQEHAARQSAWTAAGHAGAPPVKQFPPLGPNASHGCRQLWRRIIQGRARVIHGKDPMRSPFDSFQATYTMSDDALLAAVNAHTLYASWPEYDNKPSADPR